MVRGVKREKPDEVEESLGLGGEDTSKSALRQPHTCCVTGLCALRVTAEVPPSSNVLALFFRRISYN